MAQQQRHPELAEHVASIDITHSPELARAAEEVKQTRIPRVLRRGNEDVALIVPMPISQRRRRGAPGNEDADRAAFLQALGSWADVDTERLKQEIKEARSARRPPTEL